MPLAIAIAAYILLLLITGIYTKLLFHKYPNKRGAFIEYLWTTDVCNFFIVHGIGNYGEIERLNDGCTYDYVAAGLREWYGIDISSQELALLLYGAEGLLPREIRYKRQLAKQEKKANQTE